MRSKFKEPFYGIQHYLTPLNPFLSKTFFLYSHSRCQWLESFDHFLKSTLTSVCYHLIIILLKWRNLNPFARIYVHCTRRYHKILVRSFRLGVKMTKWLSVFSNWWLILWKSFWTFVRSWSYLHLKRVSHEEKVK